MRWCICSWYSVYLRKPRILVVQHQLIKKKKVSISTDVRGHLIAWPICQDAVLRWFFYVSLSAQTQESTGSTPQAGVAVTIALVCSFPYMSGRIVPGFSDEETEVPDGSAETIPSQVAEAGLPLGQGVHVCPRRVQLTRYPERTPSSHILWWPWGMSP